MRAEKKKNMFSQFLNLSSFDKSRKRIRNKNKVSNPEEKLSWSKKLQRGKMKEKNEKLGARKSNLGLTWLGGSKFLKRSKASTRSAGRGVRLLSPSTRHPDGELNWNLSIFHAAHESPVVNVINTCEHKYAR